jgi:3-hydroxyacyl-CoA dehydrogenase/enoyl-CoA hydratase/carnithine racemase
MGEDVTSMSDEAQFKVRWYQSPAAGRLALVTMDNGHDHTRPTVFGAQALASLHAALDEVETQGDTKGLLLTGKPFIFAVGADVKSFSGATEELARMGGQAGHQAFLRIKDLPFPTLAAINGACMGGGLEIALHCDYRTLSTSAAAIAFPEVFLGILPAWGGTQLAPRLIGIGKALDVIVVNALNNNRVLKPQQAVQLGLADRLIPAVDFLDESVTLLERLVTGEETITRTPPSEDVDAAVANARRFADDKVHGVSRAPYLAIDLIEFAARGGDLVEGYRREEDALAELLPSRQAQASIYSFGLTQQRVKRQPWKPDAAPRPVRKVGIVGSGLMGAQLGMLFLQRLEVPLVMKDIDEAVLQRARQHIEGEVDKLAAKGRIKLGKAAFLKSLVTYTTEYEPLAGADFVLEAVVEVLDLKKAIFSDVENIVDAGCVLATNTSSLSVAEMAAELQHPERVVGFHFFNPVAVLPLLEVVRAERSSDEAMATAFDVAKRLRKSAVQCADTPAFVVNRILTKFMGACAEAVNKGNDFAEVDDAVKELGLPMGPFELLGLVGLKVAAHVGETLHNAYPDRFRLDPNMQMLGDSGLPGIYDWSRGRVPYEQILRSWAPDASAEKLTPDQIRQTALEAVADEIRFMLDEGVVADARDIDTCMLLGAGWPFFMGGICMYLDQIGLSEKLFGAPLVGETDKAGAPT